jgi:processive 1,2-diacylglycerol beta-glucosyltransferase
MVRAVMLTAGFGDGHHKVAEALAERFRARGAEPMIMDCYRSNHPKMADFGEWVYEWTTRYTPALYGASYYLTADMGPDHWLWRMLSSMSRKRLLDSLDRLQADIILQLFPDHVLAGLPVDENRPFIGTVLTDYSIHGRWFHKNVDAYFIPDERVRRAVSPFVSDHAQCIVTGIPIRQQFRVCSLNHDVPAPPYILIATGGRGVFPELESTVRMLQMEWPVHEVYVMCGRNEQMRAQVDALEGPVHGVPYVQNIAAWLQRADFAVIKSGGITVAECLASATPMLVFRPQPGQEAGNARFAVRMGAAKAARDLVALERVVKRMATANTLSQMRAACLSLAHLDAADKVVQACLTSISER